MIYQFLYYQNRIAKAIAAGAILRVKIKPRLKRGLNGGVNGIRTRGLCLDRAAC